MGDEVKTTVQCPTVGRVVYYKSRGSADGKYPKLDRAAIVTQVVDADKLIIGICVLNPTGMFFLEEVGNGQEGGLWDWMPYQKDVQKRYAEEKALGAKPTPNPVPLAEKQPETPATEPETPVEPANDQSEPETATEPAVDPEKNSEEAPATPETPAEPTGQMQGELENIGGNDQEAVPTEKEAGTEG